MSGAILVTGGTIGDFVVDGLTKKGRNVRVTTYKTHFSSTVGYFRFFTGDFLVQTPPGKNVCGLYAA